MVTLNFSTLAQSGHKSFSPNYPWYVYSSLAYLAKLNKIQWLLTDIKYNLQLVILMNAFRTTSSICPYKGSSVAVLLSTGLYIIEGISVSQ